MFGVTITHSTAKFNLAFALTGSDFHFATLPSERQFAHSITMKKLILLMALAACSAQTPTASKPVAVGDALPTGMDDTCHAVRYHTLLNQDATQLEKILILGQVRIIRPGTIVTQDYAPQRMNFHVGENGKINQISCG